MIEAVKSLIAGTLRRLTVPGISVRTWALTIAANVGGESSSVWTDSGPEWLRLLILGVWVCFIGYAYWRLTRDVANAQGSKGAFFLWLSWSLFAYLPAVIVAAIIAESGYYYGRNDYSLALAAVCVALLPALATPMMVHASGRAIDALGPDFGHVWQHLKKNYWALVIAYSLVTIPFMLMSQLAGHLDYNEKFLNLLSSILYLPASVLSILLTVEAFQSVPRKATA